MDRERLDNWCQKGMLGLILAMLVFGPVAFGAIYIQGLLVLLGLALGVILLWLIRLWVSPSYRVLWPPICWAVLVFVVYAICRYFQADVEYVARWELIRILVYAFVFLAIVANLSDRKSSKAIAFTLVIVATVIATLAIYQFTTRSGRILYLPKPIVYFGRASGTYICPDHLAGFLEMVLPIALAYTLAGRVGHMTRVGLAYATLAILAGIGMTLSRGGCLATGLALAAFLAVLAWQRFHRLPALFALVALLVLGGVFVAQSTHFQRRIQGAVMAGKVNDIRVPLWRAAVQMWRDHFWWGVGPAHYDCRFRQYRPEGVQTRPVWTHNDYLNTLAEWGTVGTMIIASAWVLLGVGVWRTWKHVRRESLDLASALSNRFALLVGASTGLLALLLHSVVDFNLHIPANALVCVALLALVSGQWRHATEAFWFKPGPAVKVLATLVGLAGLLYLGHNGLKRQREVAILTQASKQAKTLQEQLDLFKEAARIEPQNEETSLLVGELLRRQSSQGHDDYAALAMEAMKWFERGMALNPFEPGHPLRYGMCLDWLERHEEAAIWFERARRLDPNFYRIAAHIGWHFIQIGDYATAKKWFERSLSLNTLDNPLARSYIEIVNRRLETEAAVGKPAK